MMIDVERNYYEILELEPTATRQEIEEAYIKAKDTYSPSSPALYSMFSPEEANELHGLIERAYVVLTHPDKRRDYDQNLHKSSSEQNISNKENDHDKTVESKSTPMIEEKAIFDGNQIVKNYEKDSDMEEAIKNFTDCNGAFIKKVRNYKDITLEELSEFSKISKTSILAVEAEDFENLPVKVFVRGFVSQITKLIGLDHKKAADLYMAIYDEQNQQ